MEMVSMLGLRAPRSPIKSPTDSNLSAATSISAMLVLDGRTVRGLGTGPFWGILERGRGAGALGPRLLSTPLTVKFKTCLYVCVYQCPGKGTTRRTVIGPLSNP